MVLIDGRIRSRKYSGKDGIEHIVYNNIGSEMKMLDIRNETTVMSDNGNSAPAATNSPLSELSIQTSCPTVLAVDMAQVLIFFFILSNINNILNILTRCYNNYLCNKLF